MLFGLVIGLLIALIAFCVGMGAMVIIELFNAFIERHIKLKDFAWHIASFLLGCGIVGYLCALMNFIRES